MHSLRTFRFLILLLMFAGAASAQDVLVCDFNGTSPGANAPWVATMFLSPGVTYSGWSHGAGSFGRPEINNRFGFHVNAPGDTQSTLAEAIAQNEFIRFTLTPQGGQPLDLNGMEVAFGIKRETYHAARRYALFTSVAGFLPGGQVFTTRSFDSEEFQGETFRFFLPLSGYDGLTSSIEFRLYAYEANYNHATSLTSFSITHFAGNVHTLMAGAGSGGSVTPTPEGTLFRENEVVLLRAAPDVGHRFAGWSGDVTGFGNPLTVVMDGDKNITGNFAANPPPEMEVGTNLGGVEDWSTDWPFVDQYRRARIWETRNADGSGGWGSPYSNSVPRDANGWPTHVPFDPGGGGPMQIVHTVIQNVVTGPCTFRYEGTGQIRILWYGGSWTTINASGGAGTLAMNVAGQGAQIFIEIHQSSAGDPIRNLRVIPEAFAATHETQPFHPLYKQRLGPFVNLRYMDWGRTNASPLATWADRTTPSSFTQARRQGVALEFMADLANELDQDPWVCIPHAADDEYVRECARLLRDRVESGRKIYIEYSNETWNSAGPFGQTVYVQDRGEALGLAADRWTAGQRYCSLRSVQIWSIFEEEFGGDERLVKVLATQAVNTNITMLRTNALNDPALNPERVMPDALAIAPYFGRVYTPSMISADGYPSVDVVVTTVSQGIIAASPSYIRQQKAIADGQGWRLIAYEGGQHFVGGAGAENDQMLTDILIAANRDPRMYDRYTEYLNMLKDEGVELFSNFSFVGAPSKWGSWGVLEYQDQDPAQAHKYRALVDWIAAQQSANSVAQWATF